MDFKEAKKVKLVIGSDHGGYELKESIVKHLRDKGFSLKDLGTYNTDPVDYPDIARVVAKAVAAKKFKFGILVCGTGLGMAISANKIKGIRAVTVHTLYEAEMARAHNNANILTLGGRVIDKKTALELVDKFLSTKFEGGRHLKRVKKIEG
jgi:ribose 5-phosphate isomerase B